MTPLAEVGTIQLEFRYLSKHVNDPKYANQAEDVIRVLKAHSPANGLFPTLINPDTGAPANRLVSFGALGDSFYEYLLKVQRLLLSLSVLHSWPCVVFHVPWLCVTRVLVCPCVQAWIQGGKKEDLFLDMYDLAMDGLTSTLLQRSQPSNLLFIADADGQRLKLKMDHLACFAPGMLALGAFNACVPTAAAACVLLVTCCGVLLLLVLLLCVGQ